MAEHVFLGDAGDGRGQAERASHPLLPWPRSRHM